MLRAHLTETKHCYLHPHRVVRTACARCKTPYCDECLETRDTGLFAKIVARDDRKPAPLFCERCVAEVEALEVAEAYRKRPLHQRLRPTEAGLRRATIWVAVIAVLLVPMAIAVRGLSETTITPEELARIRQGLMGGFTTRDGINFVSETFGGRYVRASAASASGHQPTRLIDGWATAEVPAWRSVDGASLPLDLVFELPSRLKIDSVIVRGHPTEPAGTWVKDFEIFVSEEPAEASFQRVHAGRLTLPTERPAGASDDPRFSFAERDARFVLLRVLTTQEGARAEPYASLAEFEVYWSGPPRNNRR